MTSLSAIANRVMVLARRHETVYEGRTTVWHEWGQGTPLVLLHGGSGSWTHWLHNVLPLSDAGYRVIAPDIPGFGDSDVAAVEGGDAPGTVAPLWAGLDQLVQGPCPVVGFSFGAMIAVMMAIARPQWVHHLVLVAPPGLGLREEGDKLLPWRNLADSVLGILPISITSRCACCIVRRPSMTMLLLFMEPTSSSIECDPGAYIRLM
jgi:2-hydroxy-6-oxonona-2,4-dienedioate hydrolase